MIMCDRQLIFAAGRHFPSCHASTILPLEHGEILVAYFAGSAEGDPDVAIWLSRRVGGIWLDPVRLAKSDRTAHWNPVLFRTSQESDAPIRLVYKTGLNVAGWQSWTMTSSDRGQTWTEPVRYGQPDPAVGPVRSKPIWLADGTLLAPNSTETGGEWLPRVDGSLDGGCHFARLSAIPINHTRPEGPHYLDGAGAIQPTLWESRPGQVHALLRTTSGLIFRSDSVDSGRSWCLAYATPWPNNNSGIDLAQDGQTLYLVLNPVSGNWAARYPLVVWRSSDNSLSFQPFAVLDDVVDPDSPDWMNVKPEFSYPATVVKDSRLYISYTYLRRQIAFCEIDLHAVC